MSEHLETDAEPRHAEPCEGHAGVAVNDLDEHLAWPVESPAHRHTGVVARRIHPMQFAAGLGINESHKILLMRGIVGEAAVAVDQKCQLGRHRKTEPNAVRR